MGSFRRGLILALLPTSAFAEVCSTERPNWDGMPVSMIAEALALFTTPGALFLLAATVVALFLRNSNGVLVVTCLWSGLVTIVATTGGEVRAAAVEEGCVSSPALFIVAVAAICGCSILYTLRRNTRL
jgi:hypothetical protein